MDDQIDRDSSQVPNTYPGNGKLLCRICQKPYLDHEIGRCPQLDSSIRLTYSTLNKRTYDKKRKKKT